MPLPLPSRNTGLILTVIRASPRTFQRISCESQLADDVTGDVRLDALALLGVSFSRLQEVVKLLRVKLLQTRHTEGGA